MNEIEKLYDNAGVNQVCNTCELRGFKRLCPTKELCVQVNPPFTAEKQLKIIMNFDNFEMRFEKSEYLLFISCPPTRYHSHHKKFEIALAKLINLIWQHLTEQEQQQIKEILQ